MSDPTFARHRPKFLGESGFSIVELLAVSAISVIVVGIGFPVFQSTSDTLRVRGAIRSVQTELQAARHRAVASQRPVRVRLNCPAAGEFRVVELIGSTSEPDPADTASDRCSEGRYPYPAADTNVLTRPNVDGPIRRLPREVAFVNPRTIEFWPDGTAHMDQGTNPWATIPPAGISITAANSVTSRSVSINGLGKIQAQ